MALNTDNSSPGSNEAARPISFSASNPSAPSSANQSAFSFGSSPISTSLFASSINTSPASGFPETNTAPSTTSNVFNCNPFRCQNTPAPSSTSANANANAKYAFHFPPTTASPSSPLFGITNPTPASFPATTMSPSSSLFGLTNPAPASFLATTTSPSSSVFGVTKPAPGFFPATTASTSSSLFGGTNSTPASFPTTTVSTSSSLFGLTNPTPASFPATTASPLSSLFGITNPTPASFPATTASPWSSLFGGTNPNPSSFPATTASMSSSLFRGTNSTPASFQLTAVSPSSSVFGVTNPNPASFLATTVSPLGSLFGVTNPPPALFLAITTLPWSSLFGNVQSEPASSSTFTSSIDNIDTRTQAPSFTAPLVCSPAPKFGDGFLHFSKSANAFSRYSPAPAPLINHSTTPVNNFSNFPASTQRLGPVPCAPSTMFGKHSGSCLGPYSQTREAGSNEFLVSISASPVYENKSHEELRLEDYKLQGKTKNVRQKRFMQNAESAELGQAPWALPVLLLPAMPFFNFSGSSATPAGTQAGGSSLASDYGPTATFMNSPAFGQSSSVPASILPIIPGVLPLCEMFHRQ
ncbi:unnamed protein product [Dovyalis caffra]|uniref:Uncharacterized protein n=1 Tax=Dovyalis caffra TaxID=77055 RepID=A0AAV1RII5_9ROSI|nr:unnamed protein product [Dovyalis caffra]